MLNLHVWILNCYKILQQKFSQNYQHVLFLRNGEIKRDKIQKNPFAVKEPYYLPGYTGHCPSYKGVVGTSFGRATHEIMEGLPSPPGRLKPVVFEDQKPKEAEELNIFESRKSEGKFVLAKDIASGYKGHIPRARDVIGLSFNKSCIKSVAEFEKKKQYQEEFLKSANIMKGGG